MAIGSIAQQGIMGGGVNQMREAAQPAATARAQKNQEAAAAKKDRVDFSVGASGLGQSAQNGQTPNTAPLFSAEIESSIGRIQNILKGNTATGSMLANQKPAVVNDPNKGLVQRSKEDQAQAEMRASAEREQRFAQKSISSPANGSLNALIKQLEAAQQSRSGVGGQTQAQAQMASQMVV